MLLGKHRPGADLQLVAPSEPSLADKIDFLMRRDAYRPPAPEVTRQETHMSQVFLAGDRSTSSRSRCVSPTSISQRSPAARQLVGPSSSSIVASLPMFIATSSLWCWAQGLAIGGKGEIVDWRGDESSGRDPDARPRHQGRKAVSLAA